MSDNVKKTDLIIIGCGSIAMEYVSIVKDLGKVVHVFGRGIKSAENFTQKTNLEVCLVPVSTYYINKTKVPKQAIVAVNVDTLKDVTVQLIKVGVKHILVEKPGGLNLKEIKEIYDLAKKHKAKVFIAYNRRFFSSVIELKKRVKKEGLLSVKFDFTEWAQRIEGIQKNKLILENWFLANTTHVIDLAFSFMGQPKKMVSNVAPGLKWHKNAVYSGSGISKKNVVFSYHANWISGGRWMLECFTKENRYLLCPMEELQVQKLNSIIVEKVDIDDEFDKKYKPGFYLQTKCFLQAKFSDLCSIDEHYLNTKTIYSKINA